MPDAISINIAAIFIGISLFSSKNYYFRKMSFNPKWIPISATTLLVFSITSLFLSAIFSFVRKSSRDSLGRRRLRELRNCTRRTGAVLAAECRLGVEALVLARAIPPEVEARNL